MRILRRAPPPPDAVGDWTLLKALKKVGSEVMSGVARTPGREEEPTKDGGSQKPDRENATTNLATENRPTRLHHQPHIRTPHTGVTPIGKSIKGGGGEEGGGARAFQQKRTHRRGRGRATRVAPTARPGPMPPGHSDEAARPGLWWLILLLLALPHQTAPVVLCLRRHFQTTPLKYETVTNHAV